MGSKVIKIGLLLATFVSFSASARDVIITNKLQDKWLIVQQLYKLGVISEQQADTITIAPGSIQSWVIRTPADADYLYGVKIWASKDPNSLSDATLVCKSNVTKTSGVWFPFDYLNVDCDEDYSLSEQPGYDPENEPFSVVIKPVSQVAQVSQDSQENNG